ncbi:Unknown protein sequence [Pseudomonas syringae pv. rhaphiolepidis]|nr:Unknown protein sequence [Pseudomonas syringae pv. rhaphiolepidis]KWS32317.1 hypothetical protein AL060_05710 [Pseudomonas syringae pv. rhaphiolepidis]
MTIIFRKTEKSFPELMISHGIANFAGPAGLEDLENQAADLDALLHDPSFYEFVCAFTTEQEVTTFQRVHPKSSIKITHDMVVDDFYERVYGQEWQGWKYKSIYACDQNTCFLLILSDESPPTVEVEKVHEAFMQFGQCILIYPA